VKTVHTSLENGVDIIETYEYPLVTVEVYIEDFYAKGNAKCDPSDEWDEKFGKDLAALRATGRIYAKMAKYQLRQAAILQHSMG
jgi:hypothetical protein